MITIRSLLVLAIVAVALSCGGEDSGFTGFEDSTLDTYEVAVIPDFEVLGDIINRPDERFVMVNMLVFKDMATGEGFEGLTGPEAYQLYVDGLVEAQMEIDSRLIWAGDVDAQIVGESDPVFHSIGLLEYASPTAFLGFATEPGENPEARSAGLLGQWLVASTTLEEGNSLVVGDENPPAELPDTATLVQTTGLSEEQIGRVLDGPTDQPVAIVELLRFAGGDRTTYSQYEEGLALVLEDQGARFVWRGSYDTYVLGRAVPAFDEMVVTVYPNRAAYLLTLSDPRVAAVSRFRVTGLDNHWIYSATEGLLLQF